MEGVPMPTLLSEAAWTPASVVPLKGTEGSNPSLTARESSPMFRVRSVYCGIRGSRIRYCFRSKTWLEPNFLAVVCELQKPNLAADHSFVGSPAWLLLFAWGACHLGLLLRIANRPLSDRYPQPEKSPISRRHASGERFEPKARPAAIEFPLW